MKRRRSLLGIVLRPALSSRERLVLLALPASGYAARVLTSERMRVALGAFVWIESRERTTGAVGGIMRGARDADLDDVALALREAGSIDVMMDVNFLLRPVPYHRAEPRLRSDALRDLHAALVETAPDQDVATSALLLTGAGLDAHLAVPASEVRRAISLWRATDPALARAFEAHDALRAMSG